MFGVDPTRRAFESSGSFYATLFHERAHSTGYESHPGAVFVEGANHTFGREDYSKEEAITELTSTMVCAVSTTSSEPSGRQCCRLHSELD